jgi:hypothetical protein
MIDEKDEKTYACIFHKNTLALKVYKVKEKGPSNLWIKYGLCPECEGKFRSDVSKFAPQIDKELVNYMNKHGRTRK